MESKRKKLLAFRLLGLCLGFLLALCAAEVVLRVFRFEFALYPTKLQFGWPDPITMKSDYEVDGDRLWVPKDYKAKIDALRGSRPAVVFMGDSCTEDRKYENSFRRLLRTISLTPDGELVNCGVSGWSSYQGLEQLKRDVVPMAPRMVTIYYGWNDHWLSFGIEDKAIGEFNLDHSLLALTLSRFRIVQLVNSFLARRIVEGSEGERPPRVSLADFRSNLEEMVRVSRDNDIVPVLITAPSSHIEGEEPPFVATRWLRDRSELIPLHRGYVEAVRAVARENDVALLDLAAAFDRLPDLEVRDRYFTGDGIHLTPDGGDAVAEFIYRQFRDEGLLEVIVRKP